MKRKIAFILVLVMVFSMVPTTVFALQTHNCAVMLEATKENWRTNTVQATMLFLDGQERTVTLSSQHDTPGKEKELAAAFPHGAQYTITVERDGTYSLTEFTDTRSQVAFGCADAFGRVCTVWTYMNEVIGTYTSKPTKTYTTAVTLGQLYTDLGKVDYAKLTAQGAGGITYYVDGLNATQLKQPVMQNLCSGSTDEIGGQGVTTEVYFDADTMTLRICEINTYAGKISAFVPAVKDADGDIVQEAYITLTAADGTSLTGTITGGATITEAGTIAGAATILAGNYTKADIGTVVYYTVGQETQTSVKNVLQSVATAKAVTGTNKGTVTGTVTKVTIDSTTYPVNACYNYTGAYDVAETIYLDANGNIVFNDAVASTDYLLVKACAQTDMFSNTYSALVVLQDGTEKIVELDQTYHSTAVQQGVYNYVVNTEGKYTLSNGVNTVTVPAVTNKVPVLGSGIYADANTIFVVGVVDQVTNVATYTTYTGIANVPSFQANKNTPISCAISPITGNAAVVFCNDAICSGVATTEPFALYIAGNETPVYENNGNSYYTVDAVADGKITTVRLAPAAYCSLNSGFTLCSGGIKDTFGKYTSLLQIATQGQYAQCFTFSTFAPYDDGLVMLDTLRYVEADVPMYLYNVQTGTLRVVPVSSFLGEMLSDTTGYYTQKLSANAGATGDIMAIYMKISEEPAVPAVTIQIQQPTGGTLTPDKTTAFPGQTITMQILPMEGYAFSYLLVNGEMVHGVQFTMPEGAVEVSAVFEELPPTETGWLYLMTAGNTSALSNKYEALVVLDNGIQTVVPLASVHNGGNNLMNKAVYRYSKDANGEYTLMYSALLGYADVVTNGQPVIGNHEADDKTRFVIGIYNNATEETTYAVCNGIAVAPTFIPEQSQGIVYAVDPESGKVAVAFCLNAIVQGEGIVSAITVQQSSGGILELEQDQASVGKLITVRTSPEEGYGFSHLLVNGEPVYGTQFVMPDTEVTVSAVFVEVKYGWLYLIAAGNTSVFTNKYEAFVILEDGTQEVIPLSSTHNNGAGIQAGSIYNYVKGGDGRYTLTRPYTSTCTEVTNKVPNMGTDFADIKTIFVLGTVDPITGKTIYATYTGIHQVPSFTAGASGTITYAVSPEKGRVAVVFCTDTQYAGVTARIAIYKTGNESKTTAGVGNSYCNVKAVVDGEITNLRLTPTVYHQLPMGFSVFDGGTKDFYGNLTALLAVPDSGGYQQVYSFTAFAPYANGVITLDYARYVEETVSAYLYDMAAKELRKTTVPNVVKVAYNSTGLYTTELLTGQITAIYAVVPFFDGVKEETPEENPREPFPISGSGVSGEYRLEFFVEKQYIEIGYWAQITRSYADGRNEDVKIIPLHEWEDYSRDLYCINYAGLAAKGLGDAITVEIFEKNGTLVSSWTGTLQKILQEKLSSVSQQERNKILATVNLGTAAQKYFSYGTASAEILDEDIQNLRTASSEDIAKARVDQSKVSGQNPKCIVGTSCILGDTLYLRIYFTSMDFTVQINEEPVELQPAESGSYAYYQVEVPAADFSTLLSIKVLQGEEIVATASDSVTSYCARLYNTGDENNAALADAILLYGLMADTD